MDFQSMPRGMQNRLLRRRDAYLDNPEGIGPGLPVNATGLPANDPLFATLSKERSLVFVVGPSREQVPLRDIGNKADRFSRLCQKK